MPYSYTIDATMVPMKCLRFFGNLLLPSDSLLELPWMPWPQKVDYLVLEPAQTFGNKNFLPFTWKGASGAIETLPFWAEKHQFLSTNVMLLLFISVPGLTRRCRVWDCRETSRISTVQTVVYQLMYMKDTFSPLKSCPFPFELNLDHCYKKGDYFPIKLY